MAFASGRTVATTFLAGASSRDPENRDVDVPAGATGPVQPGKIPAMKTNEEYAPAS